MTKLPHKSSVFTFIILLGSGISVIAQQHQNGGKISGYVKLDTTWDSNIYLSHIPSFDDMYTISNEDIISRSMIDSLGHFQFDIGFLPEEYSLFRLHTVKKGDAPASLFIGGKDENHIFFVANRHSNIVFEATPHYPPFRKVIFSQSAQNIAFQKITDLVNIADSIASESGVAKRQFIENKLYEDLLHIADTAKNPLVSLYAIYRGKFESRYTSNLDFYKAYLAKWRNQESAYFKSFRNHLNIETESNDTILRVLAGVIIFALGFFIGRLKFRKSGNVETLSAQERKVFVLLRQGATNQEISDQCHIEISTVKSHVSNIFSKLNLKSRKDVMNIPL